METPHSTIIPEKRKRGRPLKYTTSKGKAKVDVEQKRARRQAVASAQRDTAHANFYNPVFH